jgi:limonene-1,2-epoxide hydrolase
MTNTAHARAFFAAWEARDLEAILAALAPDVRYHNIPMPMMVGVDAVRAFIAPLLAIATGIEWRIHALAESPEGLVLSERTDIFRTPRGDIELPVMGVMAFDAAGRITEWRDYFDLASFQKQMAG